MKGEEMSRIRVLLTKIALDGHDVGVRVVASGLKEAGMEVIYTGPWQTVEQVAETALQEDVDVIGISCLAYDHVMVPRLMELLKEKNLKDVLVLVGGIVPPNDLPLLKKAGVAEVFPPGSSLQGIADYIKQNVSRAK